MTLFEHVISLILAALGAWVNSVAGGGTFLTFPLLTFLGLTALQANIISTIALWPGSAASAVAYHKLWRHMLRDLPWFVAVSLLGSAFGAWLLLNLPETIFERLVPWLLLFAVLLLTFGGKIKAWFTSHPYEELSWENITPATRFIMLFFQFIISIYGGYFGAGIGILMLAVLQFAPLKNFHEMNAFKVVLGMAINAVAFVIFIASGKVDWNIASWMLVGGVLGGYIGTHISLAIPPAVMRRIVLVLAWIITIIYWLK